MARAPKPMLYTIETGTRFGHLVSVDGARMPRGSKETCHQHFYDEPQPCEVRGQSSAIAPPCRIAPRTIG